MTIIRDEHREPASPAKIAADLSYELVRAFVGVARIVDDDLAAPGRRPAEVVDELLIGLQSRLHAFVVVFGTEDVADSLLLLTEAVDTLGAGDMLDIDALACLCRRMCSG